ncbi:TetR/AcrR family transcriptional regulator [Undibacterium sp. TJN25]|uniref:TetR/AcrR family transcriptional regulator n=1 Tax=Undibacterium sp. TJN25 TaxID=3413056 RepID=UPI003BF40F0E
MAGIRQFDESAALERALEVFWQKGYGPTSMQDLAEATGVQRGSLYNAYGDKESLFLHVYNQYKTAYLQDLRTALAQPRLDDSLRAFFDFCINSMTAGTPTRGCMTTKTATDIQSSGENIQAAIKSMADEVEQALTERLSTADALAQLELQPAEAARLLATFTRGLVFMERVYQDPARLKATAGSLIKVVVRA